MRRVVMTFALFAFPPATSAYASCEQPAAPACATQTIPFASLKAADDCRKEMLKYRDAMNGYAECRRESSPADEKQARDDYDDIRIRFNRRARGEFGKTPGSDVDE